MSAPITEPLVRRRQLLIECNHEAKADFTLDPADLSAYIGQMEELGAQGGEVRYQALRNYARDTFFGGREFYTGDVKSASESGFDILTELLAISPHLYARFCRQRAVPMSLKVLNEALKRSDETPRRLMDLPDDTNSEVEVQLGLRGSFDKAEDRDYERSFRFEPTYEPTYKGPALIVDDDEFAQAIEPLVYGPSLPERWQRCPARRLVTERVWPAMVDLATDTPEIFARDLEMLDTVGHA